MKTKTNWFEVDQQGLRSLVAGRGKIFVLHELIQNAWDAETQNVEVLLESAPELGRGVALLRVTDDDPRGFADLSHAFTLFAESRKKADATKRGRFNLGEKLVLALCSEATIASTTGTVHFKKDGTRRLSKDRRTKGSQFSARIAMTIPEVAEVSEKIRHLLPPEGIRTTFNGQVITRREPLLDFEAQLPTVLSDDEGVLRPTTRATGVEIYETLAGEQASIYELGIPVVATDDKYHVNVLQKVPLNADRDNVTPSYLRMLRTLVLNHTSHLLNDEESTAPWVGEALEDKRVTPETVKHVVERRFGDKALAFDPSDREANERAAGLGHTVVGGGTFSKEAWQNIRDAGALPPSGKVFPTPKAYHADGEPVTMMDPSQYTDDIQRVIKLTVDLARELMGVTLSVRIVDDPHAPFAACYFKGRELHYNYARLGKAFFVDRPKVLNLILHEFGHEYSGSHLSDAYHEALCELGAKMTMLALDRPEIFE